MYPPVTWEDTLRGRSSAGRAPDWQSGGSRVRVPSPPLKIPGGKDFLYRSKGVTHPTVNRTSTEGLIVIAPGLAKVVEYSPSRRLRWCSDCALGTRTAR